jgi:acyl carrier protein
LKILCGGEAWTRQLADELLPRCGSLWNMYGPTETTVWSAVQEVVAGSAPVSIGAPIDNTRLYVLDEHGEPVDIGVPGELCIAGEGLARGYWRRPDLTAKSFVVDPFDETPGARLYRTGDRVRRRTDGTLEFLGRLDGQVKLQGFRIELGEIESVLATHPRVREAAVLVQEFGPDDRRLVGYVVGEADGAPQTSELKTALRERLPDYMVPGLFVLLEALPRTPNGKLDRAALPAPGLGHTDRSEAGEPPPRQCERRMAAILCRLLGVDQVSVFDNFFDLGGHSLLSMRVVARLEQETGVRINPGELILQTLGQVAAACERAKREVEPLRPAAAEPDGKAPGLGGWLRRLGARLGGRLGKRRRDTR